MTAEALTIDEVARLGELEDVIEAGVRSFTDVGQALLKIRDERLYRASYDTFDTYCRERWGFGRSYAHEIIQAAQAAAMVSGTPDTPAPRNAGVAAELAPLRDDPEEMRATWSAAVAEHGEKPTAAQVRDIRKARSTDAAPPLELVGDPEKDFRFEVIEDVVELLEQNLPDPAQCVFPRDPGDVEAFDQSMKFLAAWTPKMAKAWRQHKAALRHQAAA